MIDVAKTIRNAVQHHKAGRLVQDYQISIFINDGKGDRLGLARDGLRWRDVSPDDVSASGDVTGLLGQAVDRDVAGPNQPTCIGAGQGGKPCRYDRIEPTTFF